MKVKISNDTYIYVFLVITCLLGLSGYGLLSAFDDKLKLQFYGEEGHKVAAFSLTNQENEVFSSKEYEGKIWIVNYFFTSCPSICPKIMKTMQSVHNLHRSESDVLSLSLTVDPKRDTPEKLLSYSERFNINPESWHLLTGDKKDLYRLARNSFLVSATQGGGDEYDFIHSENIVVVDPDGRIRAMINGTAESADDDLIKIISALKKEYDKN